MGLFSGFSFWQIKAMRLYVWGALIVPFYKSNFQDEGIFAEICSTGIVSLLLNKQDVLTDLFVESFYSFIFVSLELVQI